MKKILFLCTAIWFVNTTFGQDKLETKYIRRNANTPEAQADLEAMNVAFKKMRAMGCDNGLAWYYQGAIHNIPGVINGPNTLCPQYQTSKDKLWAWGDCTHNKSENASLNFLFWHRMYIWYLEKIVRDLSGKQDFALPYWNYGSTDASNNIMAEAIRYKDGSLFEPARWSILNAGQVIPSEQVLQIQQSLEELKTNPTFGGSAGFSKSLEIAPHGFMHDLIGGEYAEPAETYYNSIYQTNMSGLMANVPSAGFDPVFWLHHSMIDRIWESWDLSSYGQRPSLEDLKKYAWPYEFIAPNGDKITYTVEEMYNTVFNLDYKYDSLLYGSSTPVVASTNTNTVKSLGTVQDEKKQIIWEQKVGKVIGAESLVHKVSNKLALSTNKSLKSQPNAKLVLNLDVAVYKEPKDYYTVYIRYPGKKDQYVGIMTFFGVAHDHGTGVNHEIAETGVQLQYSYYISDDLISSDSNFDIILQKKGKGDAKVTLEKISVVQVN